MKFLQPVVATVLILCLFEKAFAVLPVNGTCDENCTRGISDIVDFYNFIGVWYLQKYVPTDKFDVTTCGYYNGSAVVNNTLLGTFSFLSISGNDQRNLLFNFVKNEEIYVTLSALELPIPYTILHATYDTFVIYLCSECGPYTTEGAGIEAYVLTRQKEPECNQLDSSLAALASCSVPENSLVDHEQWHCQIC